MRLFLLMGVVFALVLSLGIGVFAADPVAKTPQPAVSATQPTACGPAAPQPCYTYPGHGYYYYYCPGAAPYGRLGLGYEPLNNPGQANTVSGYSQMIAF
jgi:hypothetical protein